MIIEYHQYHATGKILVWKFDFSLLSYCLTEPDHGFIILLGSQLLWLKVSADLACVGLPPVQEHLQSGRHYQSWLKYVYSTVQYSTIWINYIYCNQDHSYSFYIWLREPLRLGARRINMKV